METYYAGIDLHSSNNYIGIINTQDQRIYSKRHSNNMDEVLMALSPFKKKIESIVVGSKTFIEKIKETLGIRAIGRKIISSEDTFELREGETPYGETNDLYFRNTFLWDQAPSSLNGQFLYKN